MKCPIATNSLSIKGEEINTYELWYDYFEKVKTKIITVIKLVN